MVLRPSCDLVPTGFVYITINIEGASNRCRLPLPAIDASRSEPILVYRKNITPWTISIEPSPNIFIRAYIGEESGSHAVPDPSLVIGVPMSTFDLIFMPLMYDIPDIFDISPDLLFAVLCMLDISPPGQPVSFGAISIPG